MNESINLSCVFLKLELRPVPYGFSDKLTVTSDCISSSSVFCFCFFVCLFFGGRGGECIPELGFGSVD